jgi:hypothetical protein
LPWFALLFFRAFFFRAFFAIADLQVGSLRITAVGRRTDPQVMITSGRKSTR